MELRSSGGRRGAQLRWLQNAGLSSEAARLEVGTLLTFCSGSGFPVGEQDKLGDYSRSSPQESEAQRGPRRQKAGRPRHRPRSAERGPGSLRGACALRPRSPLSPAPAAWVFKFETCSFSRPNVLTNSERGRGCAQPIAPQRLPGPAQKVTTASRPRGPANGRRHSPCLRGAHVQPRGRDLRRLRAPGATFPMAGPCRPHVWGTEARRRPRASAGSLSQAGRRPHLPAGGCAQGQSPELARPCLSRQGPGGGQLAAVVGGRFLEGRAKSWAVPRAGRPGAGRGSCVCCTVSVTL